MDSLLRTPILNVRAPYSVVYSLLLFVMYAMGYHSLRIRVRKNDSVVTVVTCLYLIYCFNLFRSGSDRMVVILMIAFITIIILNYKLLVMHNNMDSFVVMSYVVPSIFLLYRFVIEGMPFNVYGKLNNFFSTDISFIDRYRMAFGLYHVNGTGNLSVCMLILSIYICVCVLPKVQNRFLRKIYGVLISFIDYAILTVALSTNSRSSLLSFIVFIGVLGYYWITYIRKLGKIQVVIIRGLILVITISSMLLLYTQDLINLFVRSNRLKNFTVNLPMLDTLIKKLFGIGMVSPGSFTNGSLNYTSYAVDNYYLYILLVAGAIGLLIIIFLLFTIGKELHSGVTKFATKESYIVFAVFISQLVAGMGETCFLYYIFPSSMIYFTMYLVHMSQYSINNRCATDL